MLPRPPGDLGRSGACGANDGPSPMATSAVETADVGEGPEDGGLTVPQQAAAGLAALDRHPQPSS